MYHYCYLSIFNTWARWGIIPLMALLRVGYKMVGSQRGAKRRVGYSHLISNKREWNNCFIKNAQKISRILPDFITKKKPRFSACF